ncbi:MAG: tRNA pseudouridine(38-40) synthase TruA, partial [Candidatus Omnitrophica bacterium]|nr:tRNA pseudouridine(38-40) synthase TruA [Candidatus Omnitrophota bacterium]
VGTLVDIGRGHLPPGSMKKILDSRDRTQAGPTAPPEGLCLREVKY